MSAADWLLVGDKDHLQPSVLVLSIGHLGPLNYSVNGGMTADGSYWLI